MRPRILLTLLCLLGLLGAANPLPAHGQFRIPRPYDTLSPRPYLPPPRPNVLPRFHSAPLSPYRNDFYAPAVPMYVDVTVYDNYFTPQTLTVTAGSTVRWTNFGSQLHTVTSIDGYFDSGVLSGGAWYPVTFRWPGIYHYYCRFHGQQMLGTVIVLGGIGAY